MKREKEYWDFVLYKKNADGSETGAEILNRWNAVRWFRAKEAVEASKSVRIKKDEEGN